MTWRELRYRLFSWRKFPPIKPSDDPIDVVIPVVAKDLGTLPLCIEGVRRQVQHPIENIYLVAPDDERVKRFCREQGLVYVEETTVLGFGPKALNLGNRSGWLFQQFIKLSGGVGTCRHYLCIDADHVLIRPHVFLSAAGETVFYMSYECHQPYYDNILRLIPELKLADLSYVAHKMLFSKAHLEALHRRLEQGGKKAWWEVVLESYDRTQGSGFSEFELYGNFVQKKLLRPWLQKRLPNKKMADYETLRRRYSGGRASLTFPQYMRQNQ